MKVIPLQVQFIPPEEGKKGYGIPDMKSVWEAEAGADGSYVFHTHDKRGSSEPGPFYQVAFRIEDASPYKKEELTLSLSDTLRTETLNNDLYYDAINDLWYQRSEYKEGKNGKWRLVADIKRGALSAESVTAAGVFKPYIYRNYQLLNSSEYEVPWIYVLPSSTTKEEYLNMLRDLINLNERLVRDEGSGVGIGSMTRIEYETQMLSREIEKTDELREAISQAMRLSSELLGKHYVKTRIDKVKHFDSKTVRDYIKYGMTGKVLGAEYYEDHDTYENRVIKYILWKIKNYLPFEKKLPVKTDEDIKKEALSRFTEVKKFLIDSRVNYKESEILKKIEEIVKNENNYAITFNELYDSKIKLTELLNDSWFSGIADLAYVEEIKPTQKFVSNKYYAQIYQLITEQYIEKPYINSAFDINGFGVASTHYIYEYWVLYKLLEKLVQIGFVFEDKSEMKDHFKKFTRKKELSPLKVQMERKYLGHAVKIELGYRQKFEFEHTSREPDYYIKVCGRKENHWYFMDAKYKNFSDRRDESNGINYVNEVYEVAFKKYITDLEFIFSNNGMNPNNRICGSYIIMSNIKETNSELTENGRLFGSNSIVFTGKIDHPVYRNSQNYQIISKIHPRHRYGAIELNPGNSAELTTLIQMIFEYLETNNNKDHPNFQWCWRCNSTSVNSEENFTGGGRKKYYTTCPKCGEFRAITHCQNRHILIKHDQNNYHLQDKIRGSKWAFVCPECGGTL